MVTSLTAPSEWDEVPNRPESDGFPHYENTDLGNARRLVHTHGRNLRYVPQLGRWFSWDTRRWKEDLTGDASRCAKHTSERILDQARAATNDTLFRWGLRSQSASSISNMIGLASTEPGIPALIDELDADPFLINVRNGTLNLRTGSLGAHHQSDLMTKLVDVDYRPEATCPIWDRFLTEVFDRDDDLVGFVRRCAGYSLTGDVSEQVMVFAHGSGRNGKTTLLNTLRHIGGDYGIQLDPAVLVAADHDQHPTGLTDLRGARFVATVETEQGRRLNESLVKQLTGGDPIRARRMRQDFFEFQPSHKLWFAGNHLPRISGTDIGIWRRIALLPFTVEFGPERADKHLPDRLAAESAGILAWAVRGCTEWLDGGLRIPERITQATAVYRSSQDHIGRFLSDATTTGDGVYVTAVALRRAYESWCSEQGERPWTAQAVGRELTSRGYDTGKTGDRDHRARSWLGLGLVDFEHETAPGDFVVDDHER